MKRTVCILMCCIALLCIGTVAALACSVDLTAVGHQLKDNASTIAAGAAIVTASITPEMIQDAKLKFGHIQLLTVVVQIEIKDENGVVTTPVEQYQFIVKRPDRSLIKMLLPLAADISQLDNFADKAVKNLIIGGDMDSLDDGLVFMGVITQLKDLIQPAQSFLSNA